MAQLECKRPTPLRRAELRPAGFCPNIAPQSLLLLPQHLSSLHVLLQLNTQHLLQHAKTKTMLDFCSLCLYHHFILSPLWRMSLESGLSDSTFLMCSFQSVAARQEMCWCNASIMSLWYVLLTLSAGNCWDIDLWWERGGQNLCYLLILSFQHSILLIVQNKELLQKAVWY